MNKKIFTSLFCLTLVTGPLSAVTVFTVTNPTDTPVVGQLTLRQAMTDALAAGSGNKVDFDPSLAGMMITISSPLPEIDDDLLIEGKFVNPNLAPITILGASAHRPFTITAGAVEINNLVIKDGLAKGGDGGDGGTDNDDGGGGGGGFGAGGAVFVNDGANVILRSITFQSNNAVGGDGGAANMAGDEQGGGGGGGLGGDGAPAVNGVDGGGGGGLFTSATGQPGVDGGGNGAVGSGPTLATDGVDFGGGGGGGVDDDVLAGMVGSPVDISDGADGGFGGGGGGGAATLVTTDSANGGAAGYGAGGGGGGSGGDLAMGGAGAFGGDGADGSTDAVGSGAGGGGGGSGFGGAVFVRTGGTLTVVDSFIESTNAVTAGTKGSSTSGDVAEDGLEEGGAAYLMSGVSAIVQVDAMGEISASVSGPGSIQKTGPGELKLNATNNYGGGTVVAGGILTGDIDSLQGTIIDNATLKFDHKDGKSGGFVGTISGLGEVIIEGMNGSGSVFFDTQQLYTGPTTVLQGNLFLQATNAITSSSALTLGTGSTLVVPDGQTTMVKNLGGDGDVQLGVGSLLEIDSTMPTTLEGNIFETAPSGAVAKFGPATMTWLGVNSYTGGTTIHEGAIVGNDRSLKGAFTMSSQLIFDQEYDSPPIILSTSGTGEMIKKGDGVLDWSMVGNFLRHSGGTDIQGGTLKVGDHPGVTGQTMAGNFSLDNPDTELVYAGVGGSDYGLFGPVGPEQISGVGKFTVVSGNLNLRAPNTYTGPTTIMGLNTVLALNDLDAISSSQMLDIQTGAILTGGLSSARINELRGDGKITFNNATLIINNENDSTFEGVIERAAIIKEGMGKLILLGMNTYGGGTTITEGAIEGNSASIQGVFVLSSELILDIPTNQFISTLDASSPLLNPPGVVRKTGVGQLDLRGSTFNGTPDRMVQVVIEEGSLIVDEETLTVNYGLDTPLTTLIYEDDEMGDDYPYGTNGAVIGGEGTFIKRGPGTLGLVSPNTHTGPTRVEGGTLEIFHPSALSSSSSVDLQLNTMLGIGANMALLNNIRGDGTIGIGDDITLRIDNEVDLTLDNNITDLTVQDVGALQKEGAGKLFLGGMNSYSGGTTIEEGAIQGDHNAMQGFFQINSSGVPSSMGLGTSTCAMILDAPQDASATVMTAGAGCVGKIGAGELDVTGAMTGSWFTHTGGTEVVEGKLIVDAFLPGPPLGTFNGDFSIDSADATLIYRDTGFYAYDKSLAGVGTFRKEGTGNLRLNGASSLTGPVVVAEGILTLGNENAISSTSMLDLQTGTFLRIPIDMPLVNNIQGDGVIELGTMDRAVTLVIDNEVDRTLENDIIDFDGTGALVKNGMGKLTLLGNNLYTDGTTINEGAIEGNSDSLHFEFFISSELIFNIPTNQMMPDLFVTSPTGTGIVRKTGVGELNLIGSVFDDTPDEMVQVVIEEGSLVVDEDTLTVNFGLDTPLTTLIYEDNEMGDDYTYGMLGQVIGGEGTFIKRGPGKLELDSANTHTGPTIVEKGTLAISHEDALSSSSYVDLQTGTFLEITEDSAVLNNIRGDGKITIDPDVRWIADNEVDLTLEGDITGDGALQKDGAGKLILLGVNDYTGGTFITEGAIQGDADAIQGEFTLSSTLILDIPQDVTSDNIITLASTGNVIKTGAGALTLENPMSAFAHTGGTEIQEGKLIVPQECLVGDFSIDSADAELIYDDPDNYVYGGSIAGLGTFTKKGSAILALTNDSSLTGPVVVEEGTLSLRSEFAISSTSMLDIQTGAKLNVRISSTLVNNIQGDGEIDIGDTFVLTVDNEVDRTLNNNITGDGGLQKDGAGTLFLNGLNFYFGGTTITEGAIEGNSASIHETFNLEGAMLILNIPTDQSIVDLTTTSTSANDTVRKTGVGALDVRGSTFGHPQTVIEEGTLIVDEGTFVNNFGLDTEFTELIVDNGAGDLTYDTGSITGYGTFIKRGTGTLTLDAASPDFHGPTIVEKGFLAIMEADALSSSSFVDLQTGTGLQILDDMSILNNIRGDGTIFIAEFVQWIADNEEDLTLEGNISGLGSLRKDGAGTLTLKGVNSYGGGTTITEGAIKGDSDAIQGDFTLSSTLILDAPQDSSISTLHTMPPSTGNVQKIGGGELDLSGSIFQHTGGTEILEGILIVDASTGADGTFIGDFDIVSADATLIYEQDGAQDSYFHQISGLGTFIKSGDNELILENSSSLTGPVIVSEGTLTLDHPFAINMTSMLDIQTMGKLKITSASTLVNNIRGDGPIEIVDVTLTVDNEEDLTLEGAITGTGALQKDGMGKLTLLSPLNSYSGGTTITEGAIEGNADSLQGTFTLSSQLIFDQEYDAITTISTLVGSIGEVIKKGDGVLDWSIVGSLGHSGGTDIQDGSLKVSDVTMFGDFSLDIPAAELIFAGVAHTYGPVAPFPPFGSSAISGVGKLRVATGSSLTLGGPNTYEGPTTIDGGATLTLSDNDAVSSSEMVDVQTSGTLVASAILPEVKALRGNGSVVIDNALIVNNEIDTKFEGIISGETLIKEGTANLTLLGHNTYAATQINEGSVTGNADSLNGTFDIGFLPGPNPALLIFEQDFDETDTITTLGQGRLVKTGQGALTLLGSIGHTGGTSIIDGLLIVNEDTMEGDFSTENTFAGLVYDGAGHTYVDHISGPGFFTKQGAGTLELTNTSSFRGPTTVRAGTLGLSNADAISSSSQTNIDVPGTLSLNVDATINNLSGDGMVDMSDHALTVENNVDSLFEGTIMGSGDDPAGLVKTGIADLFLTGDNTGESWHARVVEGSLTVTTLSLPIGEEVFVDDTSELIFKQEFDGTYTGAISGGGMVIKELGGSLTVTGANTFMGGTIVQDGTLRGTAGSIQSMGDIHNNSIVRFDITGAETYSGMINGTGEVRKFGPATLTFGSTANTYTGKTTIFDGTLELDHPMAISSSSGVDVEPDGTLLVSMDTMIQNLEGSGKVTLDDAELTVKQDKTTVFSGLIEDGMDPGKLIKTGTGNLILMGSDNTYTDGTDIREGTLTGNSLSLQGDIMIEDPAHLVINQPFTGDDAGIGIVTGEGDVTKKGIGQFTLTETWTHTGKTFINNGQFVLDGGMLPATVETVVGPAGLLRGMGLVNNLTVYGTYHPGTSIATMDVSGTFTVQSGGTYRVSIEPLGTASLTDVTGNAIIKHGTTVEVIPEVGDYVMDTCYLIIDTTLGVEGIFDNLVVRNEVEIDGAVLSLQYNPTQVFLCLDAPMVDPGDGAGGYLDGGLATQGAWVANSILTGQLDWATQTTECECRDTCVYTPFITSYYITGDMKDTDTSIRGDLSSWGLYGGVDLFIDESALIGVAIGVIQGDAHTDKFAADADQTSWSLAVYGRKDWCCCQWILDGYVTGLWTEFSNHRRDGRTVRGNPWGGQILGNVRFAYEYSCDWVYIRPQVGLIGDYSVIDGYTERTGGNMHLNFDSGRIGFFQGEAALTIGFPIGCGCGVIVPEVKGGYQYDFINDDMKLNVYLPDFPDIPGAEFKVDTVNRGQWYARAGFSFGGWGDTKIGVYYEGVYGGSKWNGHAWRISFNSGF